MADGSARQTTVLSQISTSKHDSMPLSTLTLWLFGLQPFASSALWPFDSFSLALWPLALWPLGPLSLQPFGPLALDPLGPFGLFALWTFGSLAFLALWLFGLQPFAPLALCLCSLWPCALGPFPFCPFAFWAFVSLAFARSACRLVVLALASCLTFRSKTWGLCFWLFVGLVSSGVLSLLHSLDSLLDSSLLEFLVSRLMWLFPAGPCHIESSCRVRLLEGRRSKAGGRRPKWRPTLRPEMIGAVALSQKDGWLQLWSCVLKTSLLHSLFCTHSTWHRSRCNKNRSGGLSLCSAKRLLRA